MDDPAEGSPGNENAACRVRVPGDRGAGVGPQSKNKRLSSAGQSQPPGVQANPSGSCESDQHDSGGQAEGLVFPLVLPVLATHSGVDSLAGDCKNSTRAWWSRVNYHTTPGGILRPGGLLA